MPTPHLPKYQDMWYLPLSDTHPTNTGASCGVPVPPLRKMQIDDPPENPLDNFGYPRRMTL